MVYEAKRAKGMSLRPNFLAMIANKIEK